MLFSMLFDTEETIPEGEGFELFGLCHILWLLCAVLTCAVLCVVYHKAPDLIRGRILRIVAALILADELLKHVMLAVSGDWELDDLPFHLYGIQVFVCAAHARRSTLAKADFLYAFCLPAALFALVFPSWSALPPGNFIHVQSFTIHILLLLYPLLLLSGGYRPAFPRLKNVIAPVLLSCALIFWINKLTGCNFLFLNRPGHGNPLALFASYLGDPGYLAAIPLLFAAVWVLLYLPPYFAERGKKKLAPAAR